MHKKLPKIYYFINQFDPNLINHLDRNIALIYRNYGKNINKKLLRKIKIFCKKRRIIFLLSNNFKLAIKLGLDGAYIPSFNKNLRHNNYPLKKTFIVLGSAHNLKEIKIKEKQKVNAIFISSLFKKKTTYLGLNRFNILASFTKKKIIALGGINDKNLKKLKIVKVYGFAAIKLFKKKRPLKKLRGRIFN